MTHENKSTRKFLSLRYFVFKIFYFFSKTCLSALCFDFLKTSLSTTSLNFLKSIIRVLNLSTSKLSTLFFKLFQPLGTFTSLSISNFSKRNFKLAKSLFLAKSDVLTPTVFFKLDFGA